MKKYKYNKKEQIVGNTNGGIKIKKKKKKIQTLFLPFKSTNPQTNFLLHTFFKKWI
jgi:hypothetical protein